MKPHSRKGELKMDIATTARLILGLHAAGWPDEKICRFILWITSGEEQFNQDWSNNQPVRDKETKKN